MGVPLIWNPNVFVNQYEYGIFKKVTFLTKLHAELNNRYNYNNLKKIIPNVLFQLQIISQHSIDTEGLLDRE